MLRESVLAMQKWDAFVENVFGDAQGYIDG